MPSEGSELEEMVSVLITAGPFAYGTDGAITDTAVEWLSHGFSPQDAHDWLTIAKCFDPASAQALQAAGLDVDMASSKLEGQALGGRVSAGLMTVAEAVERTAPLRERS
jgi:hypothetical protein